VLYFWLAENGSGIALMTRDAARKEMTVTREQTIERLRRWAERANHEAQFADTREAILNWQGQAQVLGGVATYLSGAGSQADAIATWKQVVADRQSALGAWQKAQEGPEAMFYAGMVSGYDVALTALADLMGRTWGQNSLVYG